MSIRVAPDPQFRNLGRQTRGMDPLQKGYYGFYSSEAWTPCVNLYETATAYQVCVDLAGVDKEKIDVEVQQNRLRFRGTRAVPTHTADVSEADAKRIRVHLMEIDHGAFSRDVELPQNVDREKINATYQNGMLWIEIPKS